MNALVATIITPVFLTVALGFVLARAGLFDEAAARGLTRFMYYLAIPAMLFQSLANADLPDSVPWRLLLAFYMPSFVLYALSALGAMRWLGWQRHEAGIAGMCGGYANMVLLGFPLCLRAFGDAGSVPLFILLATQSVFIFPLTTVLLELNRPGAGKLVPKVLSSALRLVLNPIIAGLVAGVVANLADLHPPQMLNDLLSMLGAAAPACALVTLGISLSRYQVRGGFADVAYFVALKNLGHPLLVWAGCQWLALDAVSTAVAVLLAAMPAGINAFIYASQYGIREQETAKHILISTVFACIAATVLLSLLVKTL